MNKEQNTHYSRIKPESATAQTNDESTVVTVEFGFDTFGIYESPAEVAAYALMTFQNVWGAGIDALGRVDNE